MMKAFVATIVMICMMGCANKGSNFSGLLDKEKMQAVFWDIIGADVFTEQFIKKDPLKNAPLENMQLQNKIFALHKVTREDFYKSYDYYNEHTDLMRVILDSMTTKAERDRTKTMEQHYQTPLKPIPLKAPAARKPLLPLYPATPVNPYNRIRFF